MKTELYRDENDRFINSEEYVELDKHGNIKEISKIVDGIKEGRFYRYSTSRPKTFGSRDTTFLYKVGNYKDGKLQGPVHFMTMTGRVVGLSNYDKGVLFGDRARISKGQVSFQQIYKKKDVGVKKIKELGYSPLPIENSFKGFANGTTFPQYSKQHKEVFDNGLDLLKKYHGFKKPLQKKLEPLKEKLVEKKEGEIKVLNETMDDMSVKNCDGYEMTVHSRNIFKIVATYEFTEANYEQFSLSVESGDGGITKQRVIESINPGSAICSKLRGVEVAVFGEIRKELISTKNPGLPPIMSQDEIVLLERMNLTAKDFE